MELDLKNLQLFMRVAALGAIGRAGAEFGFSPTNASLRIKALEDDLGVKLLNRSTRAVSLTADGALFLAHAKRIHEDVEDARAMLSRRASSVSGRLRVTASASFGRSHIVPFVPQFLELYPEVELDLHLSDEVIDLIEEGYDLAFRLGELAPSSLLAQKLDDNPRLLVASPDYLARRGVPQTPQDLLGHACLSFRDRDLWRLLDSKGEVHDLRISGPVAVSLGDAVVDWAVAGLGIGMSSMWHMGDMIRAGKLVPVLPEYQPWPITKIWAVRPPGRVMHARVKAFLDFMRDRIIATNQALYGDLL
ncbi:MAG: LysR substrate-binding domain-containing protein [Mangrovicoccus sp.]|nr:LysR substrate-binding domain-containing protein [Mangrovicoccus sp.]